MKVSYLLQADFSVSSSGDTYWAVPTNELALADEKRKKGESHTETQAFTNAAPWMLMLTHQGRHGSQGVTELSVTALVPWNRTDLSRALPSNPLLGALSSKGWLKGHPLRDTSPDCQGSPSRPARRSPLGTSHGHTREAFAQPPVSWEHPEDRGLVCLVHSWTCGA